MQCIQALVKDFYNIAGARGRMTHKDPVQGRHRVQRRDHLMHESKLIVTSKEHIPLNLVVECVTTHPKPPDVRICRLRNQSCVGTVPPSTSTPHCPACWA